MSDNADTESTQATAGEDASDAAAPKKKWNGKRLSLFVFLPVLLMLGGGAGAYFSGMLEFSPAEEMSDGSQPVMAAPASDTVFYDLPDMLVNLNTSGRKKTFLKIAMSLELESTDDISDVERVLPRVMDSLQVFLRELRSEDLSGSAGMYRLKEEFLRRANIAAHPTEIRDVLFKELLVQ